MYDWRLTEANPLAQAHLGELSQSQMSSGQHGPRSHLWWGPQLNEIGIDPEQANGYAATGSG
jgi:hypothetical protein